MPPKRKRGMEDIIQSRIIKFIIDEDEVECNVHEATIANLSEPLRALVTNGMKESVEGRVVWEDVDMDTFTKLMQYAYEHDFSIIDNDEEPDDGILLSLKECVDNSLRSGVFVYEFAEKYFFDKDDSTSKNDEDETNQTVHHSYKHYMSHARLYILADRYAIRGLMNLSIQKIRRMLVNNPVKDELLATIWVLLEFIWPKTSSRDMLRELLLRYILANLYGAMGSPQAAIVFESTPGISAALMLLVPQRHWAPISIY
ncbi:hypothetical protein ColLi_01256 [Colletotrichum liriopes]|uniref:BTB domain-containing protein n=1 Tax=Colletotrichum liriopes TaxID=708192 RepID=A0AA37LNB6_9PEZI|nr:hypothetical protein ColLi_01256 [Colletotrichum liriopes]